MPTNASVDLQALVAPIAAALLPGWDVTAAWATQEELDADIPGALAICVPTPTRSMASIRVLTPWPESEGLAETLWHELTHAALSPLTALAPLSDGARMLQEIVVERLGKLLSTLSPALARVVARAVGRHAPPQAFARLAPLARIRKDDEEEDDDEDDDEDDEYERGRSVARSGGTMDPIDLILAAVEAAAAADDPKQAITDLLEKVKAIKAGTTEETEPPSQPGAALVQTDPAMAAARLGKAPLRAFARTLAGLVGAKSLDEAEGKIRAALHDADVNGAAAEDIALRAKLARAVTANKYARSEVFDVSEANGAEVLTPKAWIREMKPGAVDAMLEAKRARVRTGSAAELLLAPASVGGGEEGLARRAAAAGMSVEERRAAEANVNRGTNSPRQERAR